MYEIFYAIYRDQTIEQILYSIIASIIVNGIGSISNNRLHFEKIFFPKEISQLLAKIRCDKENWINWNDILKLKQFFSTELYKCGYLTKLPILGYIKNRKFYKMICRKKFEINEIVKIFIDKGDIKYLYEIDINIQNIKFKFPDCDGFGSFYKNSFDSLRNTQNIESGQWNLERYEHYYDLSGKKKKID